MFHGCIESRIRWPRVVLRYCFSGGWQSSDVSWRIPFFHIHIFLSFIHALCTNHPPSLFFVPQAGTQQRAKKIPRLLDTPKMSSQSNRGLSAWGENQWDNLLLQESNVFLPALYLCISLGHLSFLFSYTWVFLLSTRIWFSRSLPYICIIHRGSTR